MHSLDHTFVVLGYKESPYIRECIASLKSQRGSSEIILATSTPSAYLEQVADDTGVQLIISPGPSGIGRDWNFGLSLAQTRFVTLAHQDDVYYPDYSLTLTEAMRRSDRPLIGFCDYHELRGSRTVKFNLNLAIKRLGLMAAFRGNEARASRVEKLACVGVGDFISCPAVTFDRKHTGDFTFSTDHSFVVDWEAWLRLVNHQGSFVYASRPLMAHRIHEGSETTRVTESDIRSREEREIFEIVWPAPVAAALAALYRVGHWSNHV